MAEEDPPQRKRDATRTRADLLTAATELFGQLGYGATTLRAIGERAGVDPALVARYFGNKEGLYIESITALPVPDEADGPLGPAAVMRILTRIRDIGITPITRVMLLGSDDASIRERVARIMRDRTLDPAAELLPDTDRAGLRTEAATVLLFGLAAARSAGVFEELADASMEEVAELCLAAIGAVLEADLDGASPAPAAGVDATR